MEVYYGTIGCMKEGCSNKAYWRVKSKYYCGVHSRNKDREQLQKLSAKRRRAQLEEKYETLEKQVERARCDDPEVILCKMGMFKAVEDHPGFKKSFPNHKHGSRRDGLGLSELSPMNLGPVEHGSPNLPDSVNLENWWQFSKAYSWELDKNGNPSKKFYKTLKSGFLDPEGHRHKFERGDKPEYYVWIDSDGEEHHLDYITSRQFYCIFYERLAKRTKEFKKLKRLRDKGYNLQICGHDAYPMKPTKKSIERAYLDPERPFGHERVLFTMLILEKSDYPWRIHKSFDF